MKVKLLGALLGASLFFGACDDTTNTLGMGMLPGSDAVVAHTTTFDVTTQSVEADAVYAKTSIGYVGKFTDPDFGDYTASFLTELNCTEDFKFSEILPDVYEEYWDGDTLKGRGTLVDDKVAGIRLLVYYNDWFGDSLNACRMSVYELNDQWVKERHDPERSLHRLLYSFHKCGSICHLRLAGNMSIDPERHSAEKRILVHITDPPVIEIASLVLERWSFVMIVDPQRLHLVTAETLLDLPSCHIYIDDHRLVRHRKGSPRPDNDRHPFIAGHPPPARRQLHIIEIIIQSQSRDISEQDIIRHIDLRHSPDLGFRFHQRPCIYHLRAQPHSERLYNLIFIDPCVKLNRKLFDMGILQASTDGSDDIHPSLNHHSGYSGSRILIII